MSILRHEFLESLSLNLSSSLTSNRSRIRYSCLDISENFLVLGANTGSLYFYERESLTFLQLLTFVQDPIVQVRFSPNERFLAIATSKNYNIIILEPNLRSKKDKERVSWDFLNSNFTKLISFVNITLNPFFNKLQKKSQFCTLSVKETFSILLLDFPQVTMTITEHKSEITYLTWSDSGTNLRLFSGDESGFVYATLVGSRLKTFFSSSSDSELLYKCDT